MKDQTESPSLGPGTEGSRRHIVIIIVDELIEFFISVQQSLLPEQSSSLFSSPSLSLM
jgi:hypothetical protein